MSLQDVINLYATTPVGEPPCPEIPVEEQGIGAPSVDTFTFGTMSPSRRNLPSAVQLTKLAASGARQFGPKSTAYDYDRIHEEFKDYATTMHGSDGITPDRVMEFLTFQAHRPR